MMPVVLSPNHERGYYIVWDIAHWRKERVVSLRTSYLVPFCLWHLIHLLTRCSQRDLVLHYADLDPAPQSVAT